MLETPTDQKSGGNTTAIADQEETEEAHFEDAGYADRGEDPSDAISDKASQPFITLSGVIDQLNEKLGHLEPYLDQEKHGNRKFFELHKRLPDGSTMPARPDDVAASDLQTKVQQAVTLIAQMPTAAERQQWAVDQRKLGNRLFAQKEYKEAMDIYMTCLVVYDKSKMKTEKEDESAQVADAPDGPAGDIAITDQFEAMHALMLPVLSNLAQCALQLNMYKKCINFCTIALDESSSIEKDQVSIFSVKILFRRGKARRLSGEYGYSRHDFKSALEVLEKIKKQEDSETTTEDYVRAIEKEMRLVYVAEKEEAKNRLRQKKAMAKLMAESSNKESVDVEVPAIVDADPGIERGVAQATPAPRTYSKIRASKDKRPALPKTDSNEINQDKPTSYSMYYWDMVGRVAETLLGWLGGEKSNQKVD